MTSSGELRARHQHQAAVALAAGCFTIERLIPVSSATTRGPAASASSTIGSRGDDLRGEVAALHRGLGVDQLARLALGQLAREDAAAHRAPVADVADERARVDAADPGDALRGEPVEPAGLAPAGALRFAPRA